MITITGLRNLVAKKSKGGKLTQNEECQIETFMMMLCETIEQRHKNCCNQCVTMAVWKEARVSYNYLMGADYERFKR